MMKRNSKIRQNVISMFGYKGGVKFPAINEVEAYWDGLRAGRIVPLRSDIDPRGIERALEYTFVLERIAPGLARFRLSGMHLNDLLGMEVRGMPFTSFFTPAARNAVTDMLEAVFDGPQIGEMSLVAERGIGKPPMDAKIILLPLRSDLGEITRIIGCLVSLGPIGRVPRRFDITEIAMKDLEAGHSPVGATKTVSAPVLDFSPASTQAPSDTVCDILGDAEKGPDDKHPTLKLVHTDENP